MWKEEQTWRLHACCAFCELDQVKDSSPIIIFISMQHAGKCKQGLKWSVTSQSDFLLILFLLLMPDLFFYFTIPLLPTVKPKQTNASLIYKTILIKFS